MRGRREPDAREANASGAAGQWNQVISVCEVLILVRKGRLRLGEQGGSVWIAETPAKSPVHQAPITYDLAMASKELVFDHWDPADRFIAATAQVLEATLITAEERLIRCPGSAVLVNR